MKALKRREQKDQTRMNLIQTSILLFSNQGIRGTNTAELAKQAHVSHGTVFLHFPTREDLMCAVITEFGDQLSARFEEASKRTKGLKSILNAHLTTLHEFESFYIHLIQELSHLSDAVKSRFFILQASISQKIYREAEKEMNEGKIKKIKRDKLFNTWIALLHYYLINKAIFSPDSSVIQTFGKELLNHFLLLIKKEGEV